MDKPPRAPKPANATIQIDRLDLEDILLVDTNAPNEAAPHSVPPPLPPEEIAKAASLAPAASSVPAPTAQSSNRGLLIAAIFAGVLIVAIGAGILVGNAVRGAPPAPSAAFAAATAPPQQPSAAPTAATITIRTVELGGAATASDE